MWCAATMSQESDQLTKSSDPIPFAKTVWLLACAETMFWASCFYVFHALLPRWESHFGWSRTEVATAITISLLCSALSAPVVGALIDRGYGRRMFIVGGTTASVLLLLMSAVQTLWQFYVLWFAMGICHATILYEPCFATLTRLFSHDAKKAITRVTLMAGLASTVSFPLGHFLSERFGWQAALWVFAAISAIATVVAGMALSDTERGVIQDKVEHGASTGSVRSALRTPMFWLIAVAFSLMALNHGALLPHLLPLLSEREFSVTTAVFAASLIGPMQVIGRICMLSVERHVSTTIITVFSFLAVALASLALLFTTSLPWLLFVFVILQGGGYGVTSITRPTVTAEFLGRKGFGAISGTIAIPFTAAFAAGPTVAALIWLAGGYTAVLIVTALIAAAGTLTFIVAHFYNKRNHQ